MFILPSVEAGRWGGMDSSEKQVLDLLSKQKEIRISLDAVLFSDGTAFGPDQSRWIERWQALLKAEEEVYTASAAVSPAGMKGVLARLLEPALAAQRSRFGQEVRDAEWFYHAAIRSVDYAESHGWARAYFALHTLGEIEERGAEAVGSELGRLLQAKRYPKVRNPRTGGEQE